MVGRARVYGVQVWWRWKRARDEGGSPVDTNLDSERLVQFAFVDRRGRSVAVRRLADRTSFNARCDSSSRYIRDHDRSPIFRSSNDVVNVVLDYRVPTTQCVNVVVIRMKIS